MRAQFGFGGTGADDRRADIVRAKFFGDGIGQAVEPPLRSSISGPVGEGILSGERRDVDDVAGARPDHQRGEGADGKVNATQIRVENTVPFFGRELVEGLGEGPDPGIVDEMSRRPQVLSTRAAAYSS